MITLNKEILMHPDFTENLEKELCDLLEALIDEEFEKGDETDFDFIDECADAINAIRSGDTAQIMPLISRRDFITKVSGSSSGNAIKIAAAICAAIAIIFSVNTVLNQQEDISIIGEVSGFLSGFFNRQSDPVEITKPPETAAVTEAPTTRAPQVMSISIETDESFRNEYYIGEKFSTKGLKVFAEYDNGERRLVPSGEYTVIMSEDFGTQAKTENVTVRYGGFEQTLEVRILVSETTPVLSSIYAVFPEDFDFTAKDSENINLSQMQVYAVYSDGSEEELSADEYTIETEIEKSLFEESAFVTVSYGECSCSFVIRRE